MSHNKTLKNKIHKYISKKKDICCEDIIDRNIIIDQVIDKYKKYGKKMKEPSSEYINWINNDILIFIGFKTEMEKKKDKEGIQLYEILDKNMYNKNNLDINNIKKLLNDMPLYFLLSFLGYASYKEQL